MTVDIVNGVINFVTKNELRIPAGRPFDIDINTIINIPNGMVMIITSDKYAAQHYGVYVNPSPLIISPDETSKNINIPLSWDGIDRWAVESDLHGRVKVPANTRMLKEF